MNVIYQLYNRMNQPIKYKGQLNKGDIVFTTNTDRSHPFSVMSLKVNTGIIKGENESYNIMFKEGTGWRLENYWIDTSGWNNIVTPPTFNYDFNNTTITYSTSVMATTQYTNPNYTTAHVAPTYVATTAS